MGQPLSKETHDMTFQNRSKYMDTLGLELKNYIEAVMPDVINTNFPGHNQHINSLVMKLASKPPYRSPTKKTPAEYEGHKYNLFLRNHSDNYAENSISSYNRYLFTGKIIYIKLVSISIIIESSLGL